MIRVHVLCLAIGLALVSSSAGAQSPRGCQGLAPGVNTLKGMLYEFKASAPAPSQPASTFVLQLDKPLCTHGQAMAVNGAMAEALQDRMLELTLPGEDYRRFVGRRVLVSGTLQERPTGRRQTVLQVGSLTPLPVVAGDRT